MVLLEFAILYSFHDFYVPDVGLPILIVWYGQGKGRVKILVDI
jgi:hypothetical protein